MSLFPLGLISQGGGAGAGSNALTLISTQVLGSSISSVTFSSIPSTYKHLQLRYTLRSDRTGFTSDALYVNFNSDTTSTNYYFHSLYTANNSSLSSNSSQYFSWGNIAAGDSPTSGFSAGIVDILDYAQTTKNKTVRGFNGGPLQTYLQQFSQLWNSTSAISNIRFTIGGGTYFVSGSRISLYGVS